MEMTDNEIVMSYRQAKSPKKQIRILAQLNSTSTDRIRRILTANGIIAPQKAGNSNRKDNVKRILRMSAQGFTDREISEITGLAVGTVESYRTCRNVILGRKEGAE